MGKAVFTKDVNAKTLTVERDFDAPRSRVWEAYTRSEILDTWWAPRPWMAVTKAFDFRVGGQWLYHMAGPGEKQYCSFIYETIDPENSFSGSDMFCDENGVKNESHPSMHWNTKFMDNGSGTRVITTIAYDTLADMEKIISMGLQQGFAMALGNLDEILAG